MTDQNLSEYILNALNHGQSRDQIYKDLLNQGWSLKVIDEHFNPVGSAEQTTDHRKKAINIIVIFGAILVGLGILSLVASNWIGMSAGMKITIILVSMLAFDIGGWFFKEKFSYPKTGQAFFLLGSIIYGNGIFLVGQIYNIRVNWPDGILLWLLGTLIMAYAQDSYLLYFFAVPLGIIGVLSYPEFIFGAYYENVLIYTSTTLIVITMVVTFLLARYMRKRMPDELKKL